MAEHLPERGHRHGADRSRGPPRRDHHDRRGELPTPCGRGHTEVGASASVPLTLGRRSKFLRFLMSANTGHQALPPGRPELTAAGPSTSWRSHMTETPLSTLYSNLGGGRCLTIIGTEGALRNVVVGRYGLTLDFFRREHWSKFRADSLIRRPI